MGTETKVKATAATKPVMGTFRLSKENKRRLRIAAALVEETFAEFCEKAALARAKLVLKGREG